MENRKIKVLFVCSGNSHYGVVPFIKSQGDSLIKEGINLDYFLIKGKGIKGYLKNIYNLREYINKGNYDLVHAHYGLSGLVYLLSFNSTPMILSAMGDDVYGSYNINGKRLKSSYFTMFLTQIVLFFAKQIIVKSKNILNLIPYKKKCHIIPNGVNFEMFKPNNNVVKSNRVLILADSNDPRKNIKLVEKAINIINMENLELLNPYPIKHCDFSYYLNNSSVFVLTSYNEGSPNVIKEAMACNIPIVATDVGDVREVIGTTEGCYITTFEANDVANKIQEALAFGKRTSGRKDIEHLESSIVARKIIEVYKKVIKE